MRPRITEGHKLLAYNVRRWRELRGIDTDMLARAVDWPLAMIEDYERLTLGDSLSQKSRAQLVDWLVANKTGDERIRAGLPKGWKCGDKTGTGAHGSTNDAAVIWPTSGNPVLMSVYLTGTKQSLAKRNAVIASVSRALVEAIEA